MGPSLEVINPLEHEHWDDLIGSSGGHVFHTSNWAKVLYESYGYQPVYLAIIDNGRLLTLIPLMDVQSFLTGRRGVSLPFTDYCEPIVHDNSHLQAAMNRLSELGKKAAWKYIELRGADCFTADVPCFQFYYGHILSLRRNDWEILSGLRDSTRRNIRKAEKLEVRVEMSSAREALEEFYRLNCMTRKLHGLPRAGDGGACLLAWEMHCRSGLFSFRRARSLQIRSVGPQLPGTQGEQPGHVGSYPLVFRKRVWNTLFR
jgi:hypothetical protein